MTALPAWVEIVRDGEIHIDEDAWSALKTNFSQDEVIGLIEQAIDQGRVAPPLKRISEAKAVASFRDLQAFDAQKLLQKGNWPTEFRYRWWRQNMCISQSPVGALASDYFHQENRLQCDGRGLPSIVRSWRDPALRRGLLKALWSLGCTRVSTPELLRAGQLRKYAAAQFRPSAAKAIYQHLGARRILDFCAGWGDRLAAALATEEVESYTGIDANTDLFPGYEAEISLFKPFRSRSITTEMLHGAAEDVALFGSYDLAFTSPPYFDKERYAGASQSWRRYRTLEEWLNRFLFASIQKAWSVLVPGGYLCVNITDVLSAKLRSKRSGARERDEICDPMNDFIGELNYASYVGAIGLSLRQRPGRKTVSNEPIWVWRKDSPKTES